MQKRKILFVVHQLNYGGVQKAAISALNAIDYSQNEVTLYVRKNRTQLLPYVNENVNKIIINEDATRYYRKSKMLYYELCKRFARVVKCKKWEECIQQREIVAINRMQMEYEKTHYFTDNTEYDVAISYISGYTAQFVAEYVSAKKKVMFYHASTDEHHDLHEKIMSCFDKIVGINKDVLEILKTIYPAFANKMTYTDNFVDAEEIRRKGMEEVELLNRDKNILCSCGRFAVVKGFDLAVETAMILREKGLSFVWYFVGDGPERKKLEMKINEYGLTENIVITGMQDNPYKYISKCHVYVQPSYEEAFGLTINEAKILCKPVVSTRTVGGEKQIEHMENGVLTDISAESIAEVVEMCLGNLSIRECIEENLQEIDYSKEQEQYCLQWKELLEDLCNEV